MDVERTQTRLENVQTVEPMLGALRTISLGTWQSAVRQLESLEETSAEYRSILGSLTPVLARMVPEKRLRDDVQSAACCKQLAVLAGTERGLCGRLDQDLIDFVQSPQQSGISLDNVQLVVFGARLSKAVSRQLFPPMKTYAAPSTSLPSFPLIFELTKNWIRCLANHELSKVVVFFTAFHGATQRKPSVIQLLPFELDVSLSGQEEVWPLPIIETDPAQLLVRVYEQLAALRFYDAMLQTKASIHSARFQLMEDSTSNAERLIEDLTIILQTERRQSITREMQELAVGAGLLQS